MLDYLADCIALPDDADVGIVVNTSGVDSYELVHWTSLDAATGMAIAGELVGGEDDRRPGLAGPGTTVDQERGQVPPRQVGRPGDGSRVQTPSGTSSPTGLKPTGKPITWSSVPSSIRAVGRRCG